MEQQKPAIIADIQVLTTEILILKQQTARNMLEIGTRLLQVKDSLDHGAWLPWLEKEVEFSDQQARRLMKVAKECANSTSLLNLPPTKVFALLDLPAEEREEFAAAPHVLPTGETKTVDVMTTRELQQALKDKKAAEDRAAEADKRATLAENARFELSVEKSELETKKQQAEDRAKKVEAELKAEKIRAKAEAKKLSEQLETAKSQGADSDRLKQLAADLEAAQAKVQDLTEQINQPVTLEPVVVEKIPEETERELADLRQKAADLETKAGQQTAAEAAVMKYRVRFDVLVADFRALLAALAEVQAVDAEAGQKYRDAALKLADKIAGQLKAG